MSFVDDKAQKRAEQLVQNMLDRDPFSAWLGVQMLDLKPGHVRLGMTVRDEMLNGFDVCHGGVVFAFADSALAFASNTHGTVTVSIENSISYPAPVRTGDRLTAVARELEVKRRIAFYEVTVTNQNDQRVGLFRGTVYRTSKPSIDASDRRENQVDEVETE